MGLFKKESLHEKLAREGGLTEPPPHDTHPRWGEAGIHGVPRPREWDAVATADAPALKGDAVEFVCLPDGSLLLDDEVEADGVEPLAEALDEILQPPYRAQAVRRGGSTWAAGARTIEVVALSGDLEGDEVVLSAAHGERQLTIDGAPAFGGAPELERLGAQRYDSFVVRAERLDEQLWEVRISPL